MFTWTDSSIVLNWITGIPRRFKTCVGNTVSSIVDTIPPSHCNHVEGLKNPADCASRGIFPPSCFLMTYCEMVLICSGLAFINGLSHPLFILIALLQTDEVCSHAAVISTSSLSLLLALLELMKTTLMLL